MCYVVKWGSEYFRNCLNARIFPHNHLYSSQRMVRTLKEMRYSSRLLPLLSSKNRRLYFTRAHQNVTIERCRNVADLMDINFSCNIWVTVWCGVKAWIHFALYQLFRLLVVGDVYLACFSPISTN